MAALFRTDPGPAPISSQSVESPAADDPARDPDPESADPEAPPGEGLLRGAPPSLRSPRGHVRPRALAAALLPGLLAGTHVAGLLFFLNPDLEFAVLPVLRAVCLYGGLGALVSGLLLGPWWLARPRRTGRLLPWILTGVLAAAAALDGYHAHHFNYYLPPGINIRLLKAALWLSLAALICFYTALLHSLHGRRYGWRSRIGLGLVVLASVYVMVERREAFQAPAEVEPRPSTVLSGSRPRLAVVGLDGATLDAILPLAEQGELPFFHTLLQEGAYARLQSLSPVRPAALWTTLATGQHPYHHGILDDHATPAHFLSGDPLLRLLPASIGFRTWGTFGAVPVELTAEHRRSLAVWEILPRLGVDPALVGWPVSAPLPEGLVFGFSDSFFEGRLTEATATPPEAAQRGLLFQLADDDLDPALVEEFGSDPGTAVTTALAGDVWRESLFTFLFEQHPEIDVALLVLPGLAEVERRAYGGYAAVQFEGASSDASQQAARHVVAYYRHLDAFLARLWGRLTPRRMLAVVSVHGFEEPASWRRLLPRSPRDRLRGETHGAPDGVLMLLGEGLRKGALVQDAELVDVLPTLLYGLGLPLARDLDGRVLTEAYARSFLAAQPLTFVPSYRTLAAPR